MGKKNLFYFDEIRFLIIHLIIINHWVVDRTLIAGNMDVSLVRFWFELTSPALAVISGYLFFYRSAEHFEYRRKIKSRLSSLVVPYLIWCTFFFLMINAAKLFYAYVFHENFWVHPTEQLTALNYLKSLVHPPLANFWYLQNLIAIIPFCYVIYYLLRNRWVFLVFLTVVVLVYWVFRLPLYFSPRFLPFYLAGCFMGYHNYQLPRVPMNPVAAFLLAPVTFAITLVPATTASYLICRLALVLIFLFLAYNVMESYGQWWVVRYLRKNAGLGRWLKRHFYRVYSLISGQRVGNERKSEAAPEPVGAAAVAGGGR